ncbi:MAG: hypothetical protein ACT6RK_20205, partial [Sphingopyxis sp.]|uniref:hypothetical protein n=1 Tax=Sphingopyxis sp. TaxID=1908224 RepID=UPI0040352086
DQGTLGGGAAGGRAGGVSETRWRYWDVLAFGAGAVPIFLAIVASAIGLHYGGFMIFAGSAGSELWLASLL